MEDIAAANALKEALASSILASSTFVTCPIEVINPSEARGYKQLIIARKDLAMSPGKLAAQVSHGSMAFLTRMVRDNIVQLESSYETTLTFDAGVYEGWIDGSFTKVVLEAKNKSKLMKAVEIAEELGLEEGKDFFLIRDNCLTELAPEDEDGRTLTVVGFRPLPADVCTKISRKFQLYR